MLLHFVFAGAPLLLIQKEYIDASCKKVGDLDPKCIAHIEECALPVLSQLIAVHNEKGMATFSADNSALKQLHDDCSALANRMRAWESMCKAIRGCARIGGWTGSLPREGEELEIGSIQHKADLLLQEFAAAVESLSRAGFGTSICAKAIGS